MTFNIGLINKITKNYNYIYCNTDPVTITYIFQPPLPDANHQALSKNLKIKKIFKHPVKMWSLILF